MHFKTFLRQNYKKNEYKWLVSKKLAKYQVFKFRPCGYIVLILFIQ